MFQTRLVRAALSALMVAGAAVGFLATPVSARPASAAPIGVTAGCKFVLSKVTANVLQEANADEIYLQISKEFTKTVKFREGEPHLAAEFGSATQTSEFIAVGDFIVVSVFESDWPSADEKLGSFLVFCNPNHYTVTVSGFDSNYEVVFDVVTA